MTSESALLDEAISRTRLLTASLPTVVDPASVSLEAKIPTKVLCYREALMWRTEELSRSACHHYASGDLASAITLTRAAIEGMAATWYLSGSIEKVVKAQTLGDFDDKIMRLLLGSKNSVSALEAVNVLNYIDSVEKDFTGFRAVYENLCEYSHPNWSGTSLLFSRIDRERVLTEFGRNMRKNDDSGSLGLRALVGALVVYEHSYNTISDLMPALIAVCEADLTASQTSAFCESPRARPV